MVFFEHVLHIGIQNAGRFKFFGDFDESIGRTGRVFARLKLARNPRAFRFDRLHAVFAHRLCKFAIFEFCRSVLVERCLSKYHGDNHHRQGYCNYLRVIKFHVQLSCVSTRCASIERPSRFVIASRVSSYVSDEAQIFPRKNAPYIITNGRCAQSFFLFCRSCTTITHIHLHALHQWITHKCEFYSIHSSLFRTESGLDGFFRIQCERFGGGSFVAGVHRRSDGGQ